MPIDNESGINKDDFIFRVIESAFDSEKGFTDKKFSTSLDRDNKFILTYESVNENNKIIKFKLDVNDKSIYLYTNSSDIIILMNALGNNLSILNELDGSVFINGDDYSLFHINDENVIKFSSFQNSQIEKILGQPFQNLRHEKISSHQFNSNEVIFKSPLTNYIDEWINPIEKLNSLNLNSDGYLIPKSTSNYDHNVVIPIGGDSIIANATANLLAKYKGKVTAMQFDGVSWQWKVLLGDLNADISGSIRWIFTGHGKYSFTNTETIFGGVTAKQLTEGIVYLMTSVLTKYPPDRLVLIGCHLARGGVNENLALKTAIGLANQKIHIPLVGYNRATFVMETGNKIFFPIDKSNFYRRTKEHRVLFTINPNSQRIYINNLPAIAYFIKSLRDGELKIWQLLKEKKQTLWICSGILIMEMKLTLI